MVNHPNRKRKTAPLPEPQHNHDHDYSALLLGVRASFDAVVANHSRLFLTDVEGLNDLYLASLPDAERQIHNCYACRRFIGTYGKLVAIAEDGEMIPAMWSPDGVPEFYREAFAAMFAKAKRARIKSVFLSKDPIWGTPVTGEWSHISVTPPAMMLYRARVLTPGQAMAAAKENFKTVANALAEFTAPMLDEALRLLSADALARSEKFIGPVKWLRVLHDRPKGRAGENVLWRAVASAPEGYCHPKASVLAPLLADIVAELPFDEIKAKFEAMLHPLRYQRPQAAPSAGNIKAAEAIVEKLGIARSLERRFARADEIEAIWKPAPAQDVPSTHGIFGHLKSKAAAGTVRPVELPAAVMTWEKFSRLVLPTAERIEIHVPAHGNFEAFVTAAHADAPLIFKWENPVSQYVYHGGSHASRWDLTGGAWASILAISAHPNMWGKPQAYLGEGALLVIDGAVDTSTGQGNALFPETLRVELHGVRSTIEAYSRSATIGRGEGPFACGLGIGKSAATCVLRVLSAQGGAWTPYRIDRWD
jgi:hypothetical protein